jgi:hypothetical protein
LDHARGQLHSLVDPQVLTGFDTHGEWMPF